MERQHCLMSICFIMCSALPIICSAFFIRCDTSLIICTIYDVICCAFVVICSMFVVICCGFATICGADVIICSDFSIIPTFCHSITSVLSLYRVVYTLYGVQKAIISCTFHFICCPFFVILSCCHDLPTMQSTRVGSKLLAA